MKRFIFPCLLLAFSFYANAQTNNKIILGTIDSVYSNILNEQRKIWVYVPDEDNSGTFSKQRYPVVYLLDGDAHFFSVVGMIQQLSSVNGNTICPKMIVVGIPNTDRTRDLTPTHVDVDPPYMDSAGSKTSGGGEHFISFIEKELMTHIDSLYPTAPYRMLIGHSFGGLTVMNTLIHHPHLFNSYVAIDPSMWWDKQKLLKEAKQDLAAKKYDGISLFLGIANTMEKGMDTMHVKKDTSGNTKHIRSILALSSYLNSDKKNGLRFNYKYYKDDNHGSVPLITEYDALHFIFDFYNFQLNFKDFFDGKLELDNALSEHYKKVSVRMGYTVKPPEDFVNSMGYLAVQQKHYDKAEALFKMNISNYPESFNVYDSMGDLYDAKGDKEKAIENYKKALSIKDVPDTKQKLEKLLKK
jgi:predicted alpha/beta superfamily hydrolase